MSVPDIEHVEIFAGQRIDELQRAAGVSDQELCAAIDISDETLRRWKAGEYVPNASKLARMATVLRCKVADFFVTRPVPRGR
ncbi:MAG TPA: helix-turn-helix transcriptional regulator [Thermodesulfobacteriota bacterium]